MATSSDIVKECCVCSNVYVNPKLFPCRHSLCENCVNSVRKGSKIKCPTCRKTCDISSLVHDTRLEEFIQALKDTEEELAQLLSSEQKPTDPTTLSPPPGTLCELCEDNLISHRCVECEQWLCSGCKTTHLRTKICKDHRVEQLNDKNNEVERVMQKELTKLRDIMDQHRMCVKSIQDTIDATNKVTLNTLNQSQELRKGCMLELKLKFDSIDFEILKRSEAHITGLEEGKAKLVLGIRDLEARLSSLEKEIKQNAAQLAVMSDAIMKNIGKALATCSKLNAQNDQMRMNVSKGPSWDVNQVASLAVNDESVNIVNFKSSSFGSRQVLSLKPLFITKTWKQQKKVTLKKLPDSIRFIGGQLWQCHDKHITISDTDLQPQRTITGFENRVSDVAQRGSIHVIIATRGGLYQYSTNGKKIATLDKGRYDSVSTYEDRVYASHYDSGSIRVFKHLGSSWKQDVDGVIKCASQYSWITLSVSANRIIACIEDRHMVIVYDMQGKLLYNVGHEGRGQPGLLNYPFQCIHDTDYNILLADYHNNQLQLVDADGKWTIVQLDTGVQYPRDAFFYDGRLYVASVSSSAIFMFQ